MSLELILILTVFLLSNAFHALRVPHSSGFRSGTLLQVVNRRANFNPFSNRNINTNLPWYEREMGLLCDYIEKQPRLTAEEERELGKAINLWRSLKETKKRIAAHYNTTANAVTDEDVAAALRCSVEKIRTIETLAVKSKERLLASNMKLVLAVVSRYRNPDISNAELLSEGCIGLGRAIERYDYSKGFRFSTYATWYIHQTVADFVRWRKHPAKMPGRYIVLYRKVKQYTSEHRAKYGNRVKLSVETIANELNEKVDDIVKVIQMWKQPMSTNTPIQPGNGKMSDTTIEDLLASPRPDTKANEDMHAIALRNSMEELMRSRLTELERDVIRMRLGLDSGGSVASVRSISRRFNLTWREVHQIEQRACKKLTNDGVLERIMHQHTPTYYEEAVGFVPVMST